VTHSLHRFGRYEDLTEDYIVFAMPARGYNDREAVETQKTFLRMALRFGPVNIGDAKKGGEFRPQEGLSPLVHWRRDSEPDPQSVIDGVTTPGIVSAVFDDFHRMQAFVSALRAADLGVSVNISALAERADACCGACRIVRHSVEYALGFQGRTDRLPEKPVLELSTMCGHGTVSFGLARAMLDRVRTGRRTPREAARTLARFCVCSIFNPARAEKILEKARTGKG